jgi:hypothetical protein
MAGEVENQPLSIFGPIQKPLLFEVVRMDVELLVIVLAVVLPLYPSLFVIYEKIGKYEVFCAEFEAHRQEQK